MVLSAFVHLIMTCMAIVLLAPILFKANLPSQFLLFFLELAIYIFVSLSIGSILGLTVNNQAKLTMIAQLVFLPSIMLSGTHGFLATYYLIFFKQSGVFSPLLGDTA